MRDFARRGLWSVSGLALVLAIGVIAEAWPGGTDRAAGETLTAVAPPAAASSAAASSAAASSAAASSAPDAPPLDDWVDRALSRPLFAPDRRPDAVAAAPDESLPRLAGTIRLANTALAMFQPISAGGTVRTMVVGDGADVAGWTILDITADDVTLLRDGRVARLRLSYANLPVSPRHVGMASTRVLHDKRSSPFLQP